MQPTIRRSPICCRLKQISYPWFWADKGLAGRSLVGTKANECFDQATIPYCFKRICDLLQLKWGIQVEPEVRIQRAIGHSADNFVVGFGFVVSAAVNRECSLGAQRIDSQPVKVVQAVNANHPTILQQAKNSIDLS